MTNGYEGTFEIEVVVHAVVLEFDQVLVRDAEGFQYAINRRTKGVDLADLAEGHRLRCVVTRRLPRVLWAEVMAES